MCYTLHINLILSVILLLQSNQASAKFIVLDPSRSIHSQLQINECVYEIRNEFDLKGKELKIPENSTLVFRGGKLSNGGVSFANTRIEGSACIELGPNCQISGTLENELIYTEWFKLNEKHELTDLLNCLIKSNINKEIHVQSGTYYISRPLVMRNCSGITIDFNESVIIDNIKGENELLHRPNPTIWVRSSHNIEIRNFIYEVGDERYFSKVGTAIIWIGAISQDWDVDTYGIVLRDLQGRGDIVKKVKGGVSSNMFISGVGNMHNIQVYNIQYDGDLASLCNFEYGLQPATEKEYKSKYKIILPDYYGLHPFNITIKDVVGKNAPSCTGFIRLSSCYNVVVENCYGYNVNSYIYLYNGDMSISRVNGSVTIRNCSSYVNSDYNGKSISGLLLFTTYSNPVDNKEHSGYIEHNTSYLIENCEFQGKAGLSGDGIRISGGDGNMTFRNVTVKNFDYGTKISGVQNHIKRGGLSFDNCSFIDNNTAVKLYWIEKCSFNGCLFRNSIIHNSDYITDSQIEVYSGVKGISLRDCYFEEKNKNNKGSFLFFEQNTNAIVENCSFIGSKNEKPIKIPSSVVLNHCELK